ncbi:hypothetical protein AB0465_40550 [Streptomyces griseoviridis]|uniref:hypothetical protein n=1 Tax=Streptomyces griseoviridis TaxID=45398 RepID=UPI0033D866EE
MASADLLTGNTTPTRRRRSVRSPDLLREDRKGPHGALLQDTADVPPTSSPRRTPALVLALLAAPFLTGCAVDSPPQHAERLQKAAGLKVFRIDTSKELWDKTSDQRPYDRSDRPIDAKVTKLPDGLQRIELHGVSLANYLRQLDSDAHGGSGELPWLRTREAESIRMYDEISAVLDGITKRPDPADPPPHVVVDDAFVDAKTAVRDEPGAAGP